MDKQEFIEYISQNNIEDEKVELVCKKYGITKNEALSRIITAMNKISFFGEERRLLSISEVLDSKSALGYDFKNNEMLPIIDAYDNVYIVYLISECKWAKFSVSDETLFRKKDSIEEIL